MSLIHFSALVVPLKIYSWNILITALWHFNWWSRNLCIFYIETWLKNSNNGCPIIKRAHFLLYIVTYYNITFLILFIFIISIYYSLFHLYVHLMIVPVGVWMLEIINNPQLNCYFYLFLKKLVLPHQWTLWWGPFFLNFLIFKKILLRQSYYLEYFAPDWKALTCWIMSNRKTQLSSEVRVIIWAWSTPSSLLSVLLGWWYLSQ